MRPFEEEEDEEEESAGLPVSEASSGTSSSSSSARGVKTITCRPVVVVARLTSNFVGYALCQNVQACPVRSAGFTPGMRFNHKVTITLGPWPGRVGRQNIFFWTFKCAARRSATGKSRCARAS